MTVVVVIATAVSATAVIATAVVISVTHVSAATTPCVIVATTDNAVVSTNAVVAILQLLRLFLLVNCYKHKIMKPTFRFESYASHILCEPCESMVGSDSR